MAALNSPASLIHVCMGGGRERGREGAKEGGGGREGGRGREGV